LLDYDILLMLPGPTNVSSDVLLSMSKPIINHRSIDFQELYLGIINKLQKILSTKNAVIPLTASGTGGIEAALSSFFEAGEKIAIIRNGVFSERAGKIAERKKLNVAYLDVKLGRGPKINDVKAFLESHTDLSAIYVVYNETSTGVTTRNLPKILELAKKKGLITVVDAISIVGGDYLYVDKWKIDICIGGSQKALAAPPVLSFVSISEEAIEKAKQVKPNTLYLDLTDYLKWYKERCETPATPAIPLFYALNAALEKVLKEGLEPRIKRHELAAKAFYNSIEKAGLDIFPEEEFRSNTVIAVKAPDTINNQEIIKELYTNYRVAIAGGMGQLKHKLFRIGSMGDIRKDFIIRTLTGFFDILNKKGFNIDIKAAIQMVDDVFIV